MAESSKLATAKSNGQRTKRVMKNLEKKLAHMKFTGRKKYFTAANRAVPILYGKGILPRL